jgi:predicted permease
MQGSMNFYRWLLKFYPARFREEYQAPMERQFSDEYRDARSHAERSRLWLRAICDVAASVPGQMVHELTLDLKHASRVYRKRWSTTLLVVIALGLAIGASTGVFSVLNALLLRSLPFSNPAELTELWLSPMTAMRGRAAFTEWSHLSPYLQSAATFSSSEMNLTRERDAFRIKAAETSANFFQLLGVKPVVGRTFAPDEDISGHNAVAVISFSLWQQLYGGNPDVAGTSLHVNDALVTVIGVAPASFDYPSKTTIWMPTVFDFEKTPRRGAFLCQTIGRLKQGVTIRNARKMFEAEVRRSNPASRIDISADEQNRPHLASLRDQLAGPVRQASWVLAGLSLLVLLTAYANVAQLLLSRATERREELELRAALGASRARLLQQLITEATSLTMTGAALGLVVAHWTSRIASSFAPAQLATQQYTVLDWRVLAFAAALAIVMGIVFGVVPAWLMGRLQPSGQTVRTQPDAGGIQMKRVRTGLLALQAALALCLVTSSLAMGHTLLRLLKVDLGFRPASVVTLNVSVQGTSHAGSGEWRYYSEALDRLRAVPGVTEAGAVSYLPLSADLYMADAFKLDSGQKVEHIVMNAITHGYFRAIGTSFLAGHDFAQNAGGHPEPSVIVNEAFANGTGLGTRIIGRKVIAPWSGNTRYVVDGVVSTARIGGPAYPGGPQIYWHIEEEPPPALTLVASVRGEPEAYLARCQNAVRAVDPRVPIYDVKTLDQRLADALSRPRFYTTATVFLAMLAVLLAAVGSYGTAAYSIARRRHEMGIRLAIGASYQRIRRMMLQESLLPVVSGAAVGIVLSLGSGRYLEHLFENAERPAFWTCIGGAGILLLIGVVAVWTATSRVLSIDPAEALRAE